MNTLIEHFEPAFDSALIDSTRDRLTNTRFPEAETVEDWQQGLPLHYCQELVRYWLDDYDWQRVPKRLSAFDNLMTDIDGLPIHFLHIRSPHSDAQPLLMTHGWPGSILEFVDIIDPLTNPTEHGGNASDAFHLIVPSLPDTGSPASPKRRGSASVPSQKCGTNSWCDWGMNAMLPKAGIGVRLLPTPYCLRSSRTVSQVTSTCPW